jgi:hypothetical protein
MSRQCPTKNEGRRGSPFTIVYHIVPWIKRGCNPYKSVIFYTDKKKGYFTRWYEKYLWMLPLQSVSVYPIGIGMLIPRQPDQESI